MHKVDVLDATAAEPSVRQRLTPTADHLHRRRSTVGTPTLLQPPSRTPPATPRRPPQITSTGNDRPWAPRRCTAPAERLPNALLNALPSALLTRNRSSRHLRKLRGCSEQVGESRRREALRGEEGDQHEQLEAGRAGRAR